jgi:hypothetical protein
MTCGDGTKRSGGMFALSPLSVVKRKSDLWGVGTAFDPDQTLDVWPHLRFDGRESHRELRPELLCCPHRLSRGHEREYPRRKDRF